MTEFRRVLINDTPISTHREGDYLISADGDRISIDDAHHLPPVEPSKIIAVHLNYRSRVEEFMTKLPPAPTYFHKPTTSLNAHGGDVIRPQGCKYLNFEGEIAIVIGETAFNISQDEADHFIAGYSIANDYGLHDFRDTDAGSMLRVKGSDTLCPIGPGLVTDWDFRDKTIRTIVNGEVKQSANTSEINWDMHYLVADIARTITLLPGDVILSGTPAGSRPVEPGDMITVEVEGLGALTNTIVRGANEIRSEIGAQPSDSEEVISTALGGDWEFRGVRAPGGPGAKHYESELGS
jgi:5-oxopent-3-ene-1,2,5-tricarboxylate decarboxylase/2-hydroxyhepta-2,4-diene-1,7-dioate isomerase